MHHPARPGDGASRRETWRTVTAAAASCVDANTATTATVVKGAAGLRWLETTGLPGRLVAADGSVRGVKRLACGGAGGRVMTWYLARATGLVLLASHGGYRPRHRSSTTVKAGGRVATLRLGRPPSGSSLLAMALLLRGTSSSRVADSYVSVGWLDAVVPFVGSYRPFWLGLGTLGTDVLLLRRPSCCGRDVPVGLACGPPGHVCSAVVCCTVSSCCRPTANRGTRRRP